MNFSVYWQHADAVSKTLYFVLLAMLAAVFPTVFIPLIHSVFALSRRLFIPANVPSLLSRLSVRCLGPFGPPSPLRHPLLI